MRQKIVAGLTGGIAGGKSTAAQMFREAGAYTIDTDSVSRSVSQSGEGYERLLRAFPQAFDGGVLNRAALREIVFADESKRQTLNAVLHPLILDETRRLAFNAAADVVVVEAPLLFEAGFDAYTTPNITVSCPESERIKRLTARDTISVDLAKRMLAAQLSDAEREARADIVIMNDGTVAQLRAQVLRIYHEWTQKK